MQPNTQIEGSGLAESLFIGPAALSELLFAPDAATSLRVVDCDMPDQYADGHIPGAVCPQDHYYKTSLQDRRHVQKPEHFAETMSNMGIGDGTQVVAYDRSGSLYALRLLWTLHYYRNRNVRVLDGGLQSWVAAGLPTSLDVSTYPKGRFSPVEPDESIFADKEAVLAAIDDPDTVILDVRSEEERLGINKRGGLRGGYIPNSRHVEWIEFNTKSDTPHLLSPEDALIKLRELGVTPDKKCITYCQGGIRAAHTFWVLKLAGFSQVRNYDASWREWGDDSSYPIVTPDISEPK